MRVELTLALHSNFLKKDTFDIFRREPEGVRLHACDKHHLQIGTINICATMLLTLRDVYNKRFELTYKSSKIIYACTDKLNRRGMIFLVSVVNWTPPLRKEKFKGLAQGFA